MRIKGHNYTLIQIVCLILYYGFLRYLPASTSLVGGKLFRKLRYLCCRPIFRKCGKNVNIERLASFGNGVNIEIGHHSGLGIRSHIPNDTIIGENVMMGPDCYILSANHRFKNREIPIIEQGYEPRKQTIIEDDVWIGRSVTFTPGRTVRKGSIIAVGTVLTKDFPPYSIVGGNPGKLIRER